MIPRILAAFAATFALAVAPAVAGATVHPEHGHYSGHTEEHPHGRIVRFSFDGKNVHNFRLNHRTLLDTGHVSHNKFSVSQNGTHVTGTWIVFDVVVGTISSHGHTIHYAAEWFSV